MTNPTTLFPVVFDSTMRGAFASCPRKFYWEFMRWLGPAQPSIHLHFGSCFAKGLEEFRRRFYAAEPVSFDYALGEAVRALLLEWGDFDDDGEEYKTLDNCLLALDAYLENWPPAHDYVQPYRSAGGAPAVEFTFAIPLEDVTHPDSGMPIIYAGRFDMLGLYNQSIFTVDEKTSKQLGASWPRQWPLRAQFMGYNWAAQHFGLNTAGTIVRGTAIYKSGFGFAESIIPVQSWVLDRWREQLSYDIRRAIRCYEEGYWDYDLDSACNAYGGCPFRRLCESPDPERWIEGYYAPRHWNPLAADPSAPPKEGTQ